MRIKKIGLKKIGKGEYTLHLNRNSGHQFMVNFKRLEIAPVDMTNDNSKIIYETAH